MIRKSINCKNESASGAWRRSFNSAGIFSRGWVESVGWRTGHNASESWIESKDGSTDWEWNWANLMDYVFSWESRAWSHSFWYSGNWAHAYAYASCGSRLQDGCFNWSESFESSWGWSSFETKSTAFRGM